MRDDGIPTYIRELPLGYLTELEEGGFVTVQGRMSVDFAVALPVDKCRVLGPGVSADPRCSMRSFGV